MDSLELQSLDEALNYLNEGSSPKEVALFLKKHIIEHLTKGKKFNKKRISKVNESWEPTHYDDISEKDKKDICKACDKASIKVWKAWKQKYDNNDEEMLTYTYKGEKRSLQREYDEFFQLVNKPPKGAKIINFDGYPSLMTNIDPDTQYSGIGLDFESCVAWILEKDPKFNGKFYFSTEDYLGIDIEFTKKYLEQNRK